MSIEEVAVTKIHSFNCSCRGLLGLPEPISPISTSMYRHHGDSKGFSLKLSFFSRSALSATALDLSILGVLHITSARHSRKLDLK